MRAVQFDHYGGVEVLEVRDVEAPEPGPGEVLVAVKAAAINPGEISIREGRMHARWPATFPSGEGSDLAGIVNAVGEGDAAFGVGDEVLGWTDRRASHAELVVAPSSQLTRKPAGLSWEAAGSMYVAPCAAYASVQAVAPHEGETVVVSAAAGGVGSIAAQLARNTGARVIGLAGARNHEWLRAHGIVPVGYGEGQAERIREAAAGTPDAFIDTFGQGYVELAISLGIARHGSTRSSISKPSRATAYPLRERRPLPAPVCSQSSQSSRPRASSRFRSLPSTRSNRYGTPTASSPNATAAARSCSCLSSERRRLRRPPDSDTGSPLSAPPSARAPAYRRSNSAACPWPTPTQSVARP